MLRIEKKQHWTNSVTTDFNLNKLNFIDVTHKSSKFTNKTGQDSNFRLDAKTFYLIVHIKTVQKIKSFYIQKLGIIKRLSTRKKGKRKWTDMENIKDLKYEVYY